MNLKIPRRRVVCAGAIALSGICAPAIVSERALAQDNDIFERNDAVTDKDNEAVTPPEDLMREHGVLDRVLLVYEAALRRFAVNDDVDPAHITNAGEIIRDFINNYHEKSEEDYVFPRFRQAGQMTGLVNVLLEQHEAGRRVTSTILRLAPASRQRSEDRDRLGAAMQSFIVMYRPHAAREDTELFPKLRDLVSSNEYDAMAEDFEEKEHALFGDDGFEKMVERVAVLEKAVGINDLAQFTPHETNAQGGGR